MCSYNKECRVAHGEPTWYFSGMARSGVQDAYKRAQQQHERQQQEDQGRWREQEQERQDRENRTTNKRRRLR